MCVPVAVALGIASTVVSATGAVVSGIGQKQQADYQAQVQDQNAKLAEDQAQDSILNTNLEAQRRYRDLAQTKGAQQAAMAANGVDLNFGSATDVQRDTAMIGAEDVAQIYKGGNERTKGFEINAFNARSEAVADRAKGVGALTDGIFKGFATALSGASDAMGQLGKGGDEKLTKHTGRVDPDSNLA
jgi:hypothetical protein